MSISDNDDPRFALSLARTALDDPHGLPEDVHAYVRQAGRDAFAIEAIDHAMHLLDVELHPKLALTTLGRLVDEVKERLGDLRVDGRTFEQGSDEDSLSMILDEALDRVDEVIGYLPDDDA